MNAASRVDILLATYNGEAYLQAMLESIEAQSYPDWYLIVRDDGSQDATREIAAAFAARHPEKVEIHVRPDGAPHGAAMNFSAAAGLSRAYYTMFADQDDEWLPTKIAVTLAAMQAREHQIGMSKPILVHTDLEVVAEDLSPIAPSFMNFQRLDPDAGAKLPRMLVRNVVTGCTMMINASLREIAFPVKPCAIMHDWWVALVASARGEVIFVRQSTIRYRQHGGNTVGAQGWGASLWRTRLTSLKDSRYRVQAKFLQAGALLETLRADLDAPTCRLLSRFIELPRKGAVTRRLAWLFSNYRDTGFVRNLGLFCLL